MDLADTTRDEKMFAPFNVRPSNRILLDTESAVSNKGPQVAYRPFQTILGVRQALISVKAVQTR
jgi:hypothetical protein